MLCLFCFDYISFDMSSQLWWTSLQINKWTVPGTSIAPQVRSLRKGNNDQVAIAIDMDPGSSGRLEDEDDNKGKSRIVHLLAFSSYIYTDILQFM
jgi:hypothetical protein